MTTFDVSFSNPDEHYQGDAEGLTVKLVERGFTLPSAQRIVATLRKRRVLVLPGQLRGCTYQGPARS